MSNGLNIRQEKFAKEYVKHGNGTKAARIAGYSGTDAVIAVTASRDLLKNPKVSATIKALRKRQAERLDISREKIINDVAHLAEQAAAKDEFASAIKANELVMKAQGYIVDRSMNVSVDLTQQHLDSLQQYMDQRVDKAVGDALASHVSVDPMSERSDDRITSIMTNQTHVANPLNANVDSDSTIEQTIGADRAEKPPGTG